MSDLGPIPVTRRTGQEPFHRSGVSIDHPLLDFWQWSASDVLGNTARGILAEYIVALDLGVAASVWSSWDPFDITARDGTKIEVKSAAFLQTWRQKEFSKILFGIAPTRAWNLDSGQFMKTKKRWSDVYVFCILTTKERDKIDPLDLDQWDFYVLPTSVLDRRVPDQKTIGLNSLSRLGATKTHFGEIGLNITACLQGGSGDQFK